MVVLLSTNEKQRAGTRWELFPRFALIYFGWTLLVLLVAALILDRAVLPYLENNGSLSCEAWLRQNETLYRLMGERNRASFKDPVFCTDGVNFTPKCPKEKRILVLGDSFVWGHGVANLNYLWWRQLELELKGRGFHDVEVMGAGMCGASTHTEINWAPALAEKFHPDLILWSYVNNDPIETDEKGNVMIRLQTVDMDTHIVGFAALVYPFFPNLVYHLVDLRQTRVQVLKSNSANGYNFHDFDLAILQGANFEKYKQTIKRVSEFIKESKIPSIFVMMVSPDTAELLPQLTPVEELFRQNKIEYLDFLLPMVEWYKRRFGKLSGNPAFVLGVCPVDPHPGPIATHYYAVQTADYLEKKYLSCLGPRTTTENKSSANTIVLNDWIPGTMNLRKVEQNTFSLVFPDLKKDQITMPIRRPFVQVSLEEPARIKEIQLSGDELSSGAVALGLEDRRLHEYQLANMPDLGFKSGSKLSFVIPTRAFEIADIKISANFSGKNRKMLLKIVTD